MPDNTHPLYNVPNIPKFFNILYGLQHYVRHEGSLKLRYHNGDTLLHLAVQSKNVTMIYALLHPSLGQNIPNINAPNFKKETAIYIAVKNNLTDIVDAILYYKPDVNRVQPNDCTLLCIATFLHNLRIVQALINAGANLEASHINGATALFVAARLGHPDVVQALINAGANLEARCNDGATTLFTAAKLGRYDVVQALINAGANLEACYNDGTTALFIAAKLGRLDVVQALISAGANLEASHIDGSTALFVAAQAGDVGVVKALISAGANLEAYCNDEATALSIASQQGHLNVVQALINAGANLEAYCDDQATPLFVAAQLGHLNVVHALIRAGANLEAPCDDGSTALFIAAQLGNIEMVEVLISAGANLEAYCSEGGTPVAIAAQQGHLDVVQTLAEAGANLNTISMSNGRIAFIPLFEAIFRGNLEVVKYLISRDANVAIESLYQYQTSSGFLADPSEPLPWSNDDGAVDKFNDMMNLLTAAESLQKILTSSDLGNIECFTIDQELLEILKTRINTKIALSKNHWEVQRIFNNLAKNEELFLEGLKDNSLKLANVLLANFKSKGIATVFGESTVPTVPKLFVLAMTKLNINQCMENKLCDEFVDYVKIVAELARSLKIPGVLANKAPLAQATGAAYTGDHEQSTMSTDLIDLSLSGVSTIIQDQG